jgi:hypothetical protein
MNNYLIERVNVKESVAEVAILPEREEKLRKAV